MEVSLVVGGEDQISPTFVQYFLFFIEVFDEIMSIFLGQHSVRPVYFVSVSDVVRVYYSCETSRFMVFDDEDLVIIQRVN